jgi:hypothetical protein
MAEVLGVIASGVAISQLASQVTSSIIKLNKCWDKIKEAPDDIRQLILEIDSLNLILRHIGDDLSISEPPRGSICIDQSMKLCKEGADELRNLVSELAKKINGKSGWRKKVGEVKVVLRKEDLKRLKRRMKIAVRLLSLGYQCHTKWVFEAFNLHAGLTMYSAMIQMQPDVIVARITETVTSMTLVAPISEKTTSPTLDPLQMTLESHRSPEMTKENVETPPSDNLVQRHYHYWVSSPSWLHFLFRSLQCWSISRTREHRSGREVRAKYECPIWLSERSWNF